MIGTHKALISGTALAVPLLLAACALPDTVREDTKAVALYVDSVKRKAGEFKKERDAIAQARTRNVAFIEELALRAEQRTQRDLLVLEIVQDKERKALFDGIRKGVEQTLQQRKDLAAARQTADKDVGAAASKVTFHQDKLGETSSALAKLAEKKSSKDEIAFFKDFFGQVADNVKKATTRAEDTTKVAKNQAGKKEIDKANEEKNSQSAPSAK